MELKEFKGEFFNRYGPGKAIMFFSPGRVNLIGEHTDYNGGLVLPCALSFGTYLIIRKTDDDLVKFRTVNFDDKNEIPLADLDKKLDGGVWINYPLGVIAGFKKRGVSFAGMDLLFMGNIPIGAGLSSSASLELVSSVAVNELYSVGLDMVEMVKLSHTAENEFVGVNCGIMDQFAVGMGKKDHAIALDCNTLNFEHIPVEINGYKLVIGDTKKRRGLAGSKYNERRAECDKAVELLCQKKGIRYLCELDMETFREIRNLIPEGVVRKRVRHVISEHGRVLQAVKELKAGNAEAFGKLMNESHDSLRDDYEVTGFELDTMVEEARKVEGVLGARMTGAGFGGCTVSLVKEENIDIFYEQMGKAYKEKTGITPEFYIADIGDGTRKLEEITG
jgi:galactokinase